MGCYLILKPCNSNYKSICMNHGFILLLLAHFKFHYRFQFFHLHFGLTLNCNQYLILVVVSLFYSLDGNYAKKRFHFDSIWSITSFMIGWYIILLTSMGSHHDFLVVDMYVSFFMSFWNKCPYMRKS
jgi:hypothetical protein